MDNCWVNKLTGAEVIMISSVIVCGSLKKTLYLTAPIIVKDSKTRQYLIFNARDFYKSHTKKNNLQ